MEDLTGKQFGPYQIVGPLGEGGMAAVYKAYQPAMARHVALKVLPRQMADTPEFFARFQREARLLAQLQHPHILPVFDFGDSEGYTYIVMPFVQTGTLTDLLKNRRPTLQETYRIIAQIGDALAYAHTRGMIHRDVKPSNVLIDERGNCLLTDFGLARMADGSSMLTNAGAIMGTPAYMSPEQGKGHQVDGRSDIYSLGVILYEMVTGQPPYVAETPIAIVFKHIQAPLPNPRLLAPNISETLELILLKALAKFPEDRYQTADELVREIQMEAGVYPASSPLPSTPLPPSPSSQSTAVSMPRVSIPPPISAPPASVVPPAPSVPPMPPKSDSQAAIQTRESAPPPKQPVYEPPPRRHDPQSSVSTMQGPPPQLPPRYQPAPTPVAFQPPARQPSMWMSALTGLFVLGICCLAGAGAVYGYSIMETPSPAETPTPIVIIVTPEPTKSQANPPTDAPLPTEEATTTTTTPEETAVNLPDLPALVIPADKPFAEIAEVGLEGDAYIIGFKTHNFTNSLKTHIHFYFNNIPESQSGNQAGINGKFKMYDGASPFQEKRSDRPETASAICAAVASSNHNTKENSGNCFPLPDVTSVSARVDTACRSKPEEASPQVSLFLAGKNVLVRGKSPDRNWLLIENPEKMDNTSCWVPLNSVVIFGDAGVIEEVQP